MMEPWSWIWMFVWIAVLLFMVWLLVRSPSDRSTAEDAMAILRARYARGEITEAEFEQAKRALLPDRQEFNR